MIDFIPRQTIIFFIFAYNRLLLILKKSRKSGSVIRPQSKLNSISNGLLLILKISRKVGSVTRPQSRLNSISNGLLLIRKKSRRISSVIRSWFRLNSSSNGLAFPFQKIKIAILTFPIKVVFSRYLFFTFK